MLYDNPKSITKTLVLNLEQCDSIIQKNPTNDIYKRNLKIKYIEISIEMQSNRI